MEHRRQVWTTTNPYKSERSADLFAAWQRYAKTAGEVPGTRKGFADQMQRRGFPNDKGAQGARVYRGVRLLPAVRAEAA